MIVTVPVKYPFEIREAAKSYVYNTLTGINEYNAQLFANSLHIIHEFYEVYAPDYEVEEVEEIEEAGDE